MIRNIPACRNQICFPQNHQFYIGPTMIFDIPACRNQVLIPPESSVLYCKTNDFEYPCLPESGSDSAGIRFCCRQYRCFADF